MPLAICLSVQAITEPNPARLFFSDAKISFAFPNHWTLEPSFPIGPAFSKVTQQGATAFISCQISDPLDPNHLANDIPLEKLQQFAQQDVTTRQVGARLMSQGNRSLAGHNAFEITWEDASGEGMPMEYQSDYFFVENRVYALILRARSDSFIWLVPDFQEWLTSVRILSRRDSGALDAPAHGGLWIHQTGGVKVAVPEEWLIGVADDHTLGATIARGKWHSDLTATVEIASDPPKEFSEPDKQAAREAVKKKGERIVSESEEPFHGLPAFQITYEASLRDREVQGQDLWVLSPKGRWLFNTEGDVPFFKSLAEDYHTMLNNIQFL